MDETIKQIKASKERVTNLVDQINKEIEQQTGWFAELRQELSEVSGVIMAPDELLFELPLSDLKQPTKKRTQNQKQTPNENASPKEVVLARIVALHDTGITFGGIAKQLNVERLIPQRSKAFVAATVYRMFERSQKKHAAPGPEIPVEVPAEAAN